ncbi:DUF1800 domain-containing protein [Nocardioides conyzicola]|uniref:DUF1800 domain-containing protein n=1 Tax=Nocardioides conyzicola TaxID=1651781 RepID=A0ABP8Y2E3_9ACTN
MSVLRARDRHLVGRFSYGVTPELARDVRRAGGAHAWFERQLAPGRVTDHGADRLRSWWPSLDRGPTDLWRRQIKEIEGGWEVMADYQRWVLLRRMQSRRQLHEVMTELWENHFNVPVNGDAQFTWRVDFGDTIRDHALGRFDRLLQAVVTHPALLISLDNVSSTKAFPNENLGRELLELHTVGRGAYDEHDVKASARILTGWTVDMWNTFKAEYDEERHDRDRVKVMGFKAANTKADGRQVARDYLRYLAHHPATARHVARKLAVKFVRDDPSPQLVNRLAHVYLRHQTDLRPVLRALVGTREFQRAAGAKVRDPGEDLVASYRALGVRVSRPPAGKHGEAYAANQLLWQVSGMGITPFAWPRPDGQPIDNRSWASPARLIASMGVHRSLAGGWWPSDGAHYRKPAAWLPRRNVRFDALVDSMSQRILHRRSTPRLLKACCEATGCKPHERITDDHPLVQWGMHQLLSVFLDSPTHLTR